MSWSGLTIVTAMLTVPSGTSDHSSAGDVFSPSHYIMADVPIQNIFTMLEAVKDYSTYGKYPLN